MSWKSDFRGLYDRTLAKAGSKPSAFDERIRDTARRNGLSNDEALFVIAHRFGVQFTRDIGHISSESRTRITNIIKPVQTRRTADSATTPQKATTETLMASSRYIDMLGIFEDSELKDRCADLIKRPRNHDRAFREATTVLEDRIRRLSGITGMNPQNLIAKALQHPDRAIIVVSTDAAEQEGFFKICSGIEAAFRNRAHHEVTDKLTREDAIKFCFFVDSLLMMLSSATIHRERPR